MRTIVTAALIACALVAPAAAASKDQLKAKVEAQYGTKGRHVEWDRRPFLWSQFGWRFFVVENSTSKATFSEWRKKCQYQHDQFVAADDALYGGEIDQSNIDLFKLCLGKHAKATFEYLQKDGRVTAYEVHPAYLDY